MTERFRPKPVEFQRAVSFLCRKIETIAARAGVPDADCGDLNHMLGSLPALARDRVKLMLDATQVQAEYDDPTLTLAARYLLKVAEDVWEAKPQLSGQPSAGVQPARR